MKMNRFKNYSRAAISFAFLVGSLVFAGASSSNAAPAGSSSVANKGCGAHLLKGDYGFSFSGTADGFGSINGVGSETCDDNGTCVGELTETLNGSATTTTFISVTTVNPDCTGTVTTTYPDGQVFHAALVVVNGGDEYHFVGTDPGASYIGVQKRR
jgi:hypothetical protein